MTRKIIRIDREKCNGCGLCVDACHEGAIGMEDGKAALLREDYCDGLGNCLPVCPTGAISFEEKTMDTTPQTAAPPSMPAHGGCPGSAAQTIRQLSPAAPAPRQGSALAQWPVQIKLVPVKAPYFENADLLVSADCAAYAYANFHSDFVQGRITLIGCPKLDTVDYSEKLTAILTENSIKSVTVVRMEVPCCGGIEAAVQTALKNSGKFIPRQTVIMGIDGEIRETK
jgi:NAD-dependent dihydropyrimidine dehydrogenase PreA subunit